MQGLTSKHFLKGVLLGSSKQVLAFLFYFILNFFFQVCRVPICSHCIQRKSIDQFGGESQDHIFMAEVCSKVAEADETN